MVDASVSAKWCLPPQDEDCSEQAVEILAACTAGKTLVLVPDHFFAEMGNVLWKGSAVSTDFITADEKLANALAVYLPVKWLGAGILLG